MALIYIEDNDPWLIEYDACEKLFREIMEQLTLRDKENRRSQAFGSLSATIRLRMKQYSTQVLQLKSKITEASKQHVITSEEAERRLRRVEQLQSKEIHLQQLYDGRSTDREYADSRANLIRAGTSNFADMGTTSWADEESEQKPIEVQVSINDLRAQQDRVLVEQEKGLEELSKIISDSKQIGLTFHDEVNHQNEIIDDLADHMERTDRKLIDETRRVKSISNRDNTCGYWIVIFLLFICIIAVALA